MNNRFVSLAPGNPTAIYDTHDCEVYHMATTSDVQSLLDLLNDLHYDAEQCGNRQDQK